MRTLATSLLFAAVAAYACPAQCTASWTTPALGVSPAPGASCAVRGTDGSLIVGGSFTSAGGVPANRVARWNGTTWSAMGAGFPDNVNAIAVLPDGTIVAGGRFVGGSFDWGWVSRWNGSSWTTLGSFQGEVRHLAVLPNGDLIAGGAFDYVSGVGLRSRIARWDGSTWQALGSGLSGSPDGMLALPNGDLLVGGQFATAGGVTVNGIARWDGATWSSLGTGLGGVNPWAGPMVLLPGGDVVASGRFQSAGGVAANNIARWNGSSWSPLGAGLGVGSNLAVLPNGDVLAADVAVVGSFPSPQPWIITTCRRWDGASWTAIPGTSIGSGIAFGPAEPNGDRLVFGTAATLGSLTTNQGWAALTTNCPASTSNLGAGCSGSGGPNTLTASLPWAGAAFATEARGMPAFGFAAAVTGFSSGAVPLAAVLAQSAPGCSLYVSPDVLEVKLPAAGVANYSLVLPNTTILVGLVFHQQVVALELDPSLAIVGASSTNAITATVGAF
jgi:hypothetical protein